MDANGELLTNQA